jgi:hypothetical protein
MRNVKMADLAMNLAVFLFALIGVLTTSFATSGLMSGFSLLYYTVQSNIWIGVTCLVFALLKIISYKRENSLIPAWLYVTKYIFVVAITLTMVVFWFLLAPTLELPSYLVSPSNLFAHTLTPITAIISFLLFDSREYRLIKKHAFLSLVTPLYYIAFALIASISGVMFHTFRMPYFFIDYYQFGWFNLFTFSSEYGFSSFGVFYWIIIISLFIFLMGLGYVYLNNWFYQKVRRNQSISKETT